MSYPPEFLKLVDEFLHLANRLVEDGKDGEVSATAAQMLLSLNSAVGLALSAFRRAMLAQRSGSDVCLHPCGQEHRSFGETYVDCR